MPPTSNLRMRGTDNRNTESRLVKACRKGNLELCAMLLKRYGDVTDCDVAGNTCLHIAAEQGHLDVVELFCEYSGSNKLGGVNHNHNHLRSCDTDIAKGNDRGESPLIVACDWGHEDIAIYLVKRMTNKDVNSLDNFGRSAMWVAASKGLHRVVWTLYSMGSDLCQTNQYGETPLWIAAKNGHFDTVKILCELNSDLDACNNSQETPVSAALDNNHLSVVDLLVSYGATAWNNVSLLSSSPSAERLLTHTMPCPPVSLSDMTTSQWRK